MPIGTHWRFIVAVDVKGNALEDAYKGLLARMRGNDWESTDLAFYPDGGTVDPEALQIVWELVSEEP